MLVVATKPHSPKSSISWSWEGTAALTNGLAGSSAETVAGFTGNNVAVISMAPTANPPRIFTENLLAMSRVILIFSFPVVFVEVMVFTSDAFEVSLLRFLKVASALWWPFIGAFMIGSFSEFLYGIMLGRGPVGPHRLKSTNVKTEKSVVAGRQCAEVCSGRFGWSPMAM